MNRTRIKKTFDIATYHREGTLFVRYAQRTGAYLILDYEGSYDGSHVARPWKVRRDGGHLGSFATLEAARARFDAEFGGIVMAQLTSIHRKHERMRVIRKSIAAIQGRMEAGIASEADDIGLVELADELATLEAKRN